MTDDRERKAAAAKFKKSERATEGAKAMADYKAEGEAERAKTLRLKAQRLAKDATDKKVVSDPPPDDKKQTAVKSIYDSLATKDDNQKKARQQTDQQMKHQDAQEVGDSKVTRVNPAGRMVLSPDHPRPKPREKRRALRSRRPPSPALCLWRRWRRLRSAAMLARSSECIARLRSASLSQPRAMSIKRASILKLGARRAIRRHSTPCSLHSVAVIMRPSEPDGRSEAV